MDCSRVANVARRVFPNPAWLCALLLGISSPVFAQGVPAMVKDINPGGGSAGIEHLVDVNGVAFFDALGRLWRSDGTSSGTIEVRSDVVPQASTAQQFMPANLNGVLIFGAAGPSGGIEPWRSDGTAAGTYMLVDVWSGGNTYPADFTRVGDLMYFRTSAQFGAPAQLWRTDGTVLGTQLVKDFTLSEGAPMDLIAVGGSLFFETRVSNGTISLWRLDTPGGIPQLLRSFPNGSLLVPAEGRVADDQMLAVGGTLYFSQYTAAEGIELWKSDGTTIGTQLVANIASGNASSYPGAFREVNGRLAFVTGTTSQVWTSDGTSANTFNVAPGVSIATGLASNGQYLLFFGNTTTDSGLYRVDAPAVGATKIPVTATFGMALYQNNPAAVVGGIIYFAALSSPYGNELWRSDGTGAGTVEVADIWSGASGSDPQHFASVGGALFFDANDGIFNRELWRVGSPVRTPRPSTFDDAYSTVINTQLVVPTPGVLANDASNGGGSMAAVLVNSVSIGTLTLSTNGSFTFTPPNGFTGNTSFTYRAVNGTGNGNVATVTLTTNVASTPLAPTALYASSIAGNLVSLRWTPPVGGMAPTGYALEGGVNPGEVLASIPTGTADPAYTFVAPTGAFYVRIHTLSGAQRSAASNEIRIFVNLPAAPSAPANLLGLVNGNNIALAWRNTFAGGTPSGILLDVAGSLTATLPLGLTDSFQFAGVPGGTYTLSLRAINSAGSSASSNSITLSFPGPCSGAPLTPSGLLAVRSGRTITVAWDPAATGPAPTSYMLIVGGTFTGSFAVPARTLGGTVGPGTYQLSVTAVNPCGSSAATPVQTVVVP